MEQFCVRGVADFNTFTCLLSRSKCSFGNEDQSVTEKVFVQLREEGPVQLFSFPGEL
jgi:hypothetical protein